MHCSRASEGHLHGWHLGHRFCRMAHRILTFGAVVTLAACGPANGALPTTSPSATQTTQCVETPIDYVSPSSGAVLPSPRIDAGVAYDSANCRLLVFGGFDASNNYLADTWLWNGAWAEYRGTGPSGRRGPAIAYDAAHEDVVLYGGGGTCSGPNCVQFHDTWLWSGESWSQAHPAHTPELAAYSMAYDDSSKSVLMFGWVRPDCIDTGTLQPICPAPHIETWRWDGFDWSKLLTLDPNSPMQHMFGYQFQISHDPAAGRMVLVGHGPTGSLEIWAWDGSGWALIDQSGPQDILFSMTAETARRILVLVDSSATWDWDGRHWIRSASYPGQYPRQLAGMAYDDHDGRVLLFGGLTHQTSTDQFMNDLWSLAGPEWIRVA